MLTVEELTRKLLSPNNSIRLEASHRLRARRMAIVESLVAMETAVADPNPDLEDPPTASAQAHANDNPVPPDPAPTSQLPNHPRLLTYWVLGALIGIPCAIFDCYWFAAIHNGRPLLVATVIGAVVGAVAGYFGGRRFGPKGCAISACVCAFLLSPIFYVLIVIVIFLRQGCSQCA